jgi:hypothetical protein
MLCIHVHSVAKYYVFLTLRLRKPDMVVHACATVVCETEIGELWLKASPKKTTRPYLKIKVKAKMTRFGAKLLGVTDKLLSVRKACLMVPLV